MKITKNTLRKIIKEELSLEERKRAALEEVAAIHELDEGFGDTLASFAGQKLGIGPDWAKHPKKFKSKAEYDKYQRDLKAKRDAEREEEEAAASAEAERIRRRNAAEEDARYWRDKESAARAQADARAAQRSRESDEFWGSMPKSGDRYSRYDTGTRSERGD